MSEAMKNMLDDFKRNWRDSRLDSRQAALVLLEMPQVSGRIILRELPRMQAEAILENMRELPQSHPKKGTIQALLGE